MNAGLHVILKIQTLETHVHTATEERVEHLVAAPVVNTVQLVDVLYNLDVQNSDAQHARVVLLVGFDHAADVQHGHALVEEVLGLHVHAAEQGDGQGCTCGCGAGGPLVPLGHQDAHVVLVCGQSE